jgi:hypothetical protein
MSRAVVRVGDVRRGDRLAGIGVVLSARHSKRTVRRDRPVRSAGAGVRKATTTLVFRRDDGREDRWVRESDERTVVER